MTDNLELLSDELQKEATRFLERDFNQCFQQIRHYDCQITDILRFMFTAYSALLGISVGLYEYGLKEKVNLATPAAAALTIGLIIGLFMFALVVRNRVYYVQVARYINEHRGFFLKAEPLGFKNVSKMYTNYEQPPYYNWRSSHSWLFYVIAVLNSILGGTLVYILFVSWSIVVAISVILIAVQLTIGIVYLRTRENKSASEAVFGRK